MGRDPRSGLPAGSPTALLGCGTLPRLGGLLMTTPPVRSAPPVVLSLIICDSAHLDPTTGKRSLLGCFSSIMANSFPAVHPTLHVAADFTNGHGATPITIRIARVTAEDLDGQPVFSADFELEFPDPRSTLAIGFQLNAIEFPEAGEYRVILESSGLILLERRLMVSNRQELNEP